MAYDIGPKIGIDGEAKFRKQLQTVSENIKTLGSEMKAVTAEFSDNEDSVEALSAKNRVLAETVTAVEKKLELQKKAAADAAKKFGEGAIETLKWERAVNETTAQLTGLKKQIDKNERAMDGLDDAMEDVTEEAKDMGDGFGALDVAMGNLASSGIQAIVNGLGNAVSAIAGLGESTREYREAQAKLDTAFESGGHSAETADKAYRELYGILGDSGEAAEASQLLAGLANNTRQMSQWTEIAAGVAGTFGDALPISSLIEAANETAKTGQVTGALADALNWLGISEDGVNTSLSLLNDTQSRTTYLTNLLSGAYSEAAGAFRENNESIIAANEAQLLLEESSAKVGEAVDGMRSSLLEAFGPEISAAAESVAKVVESLSGVLSGDSSAKGFAEAMAGLIQQGVSALLEGLPVLFDAATALVSELVSGIMEGFSQMLDAAGQLMGQLVSGIQEGLPQALESGITILENLVSGIMSGIPNMVSRLPVVIDGFVDFVSQSLPTILEAGKNILNSVIKGVLETIPELVEALPEVIDSFVAFIADSLPEIIDTGMEMLLGLVTGILDAVPNLVSAIPEIIREFVSTITKNLPEVIESGFELLIKFGNGIMDALPNLVSNIPQIVLVLLEGLGEAVSGVVTVGKDIVQGIWAGIHSMTSWIKEKVSGFFSGIVDGVKSVLGIHSPSTVFARIGENMAAGIGVGFGAEFGSVQKQIDRSMNDLIPEVSGSVSLSGSSGGNTESGGAAFASVVGTEIRKALENVTVQMGTEKVGKLVTTYQHNRTRATGIPAVL